MEAMWSRSGPPRVGCVCVCARVHVHAHLLNPVQLFVTPWTVVLQVPLSIGFSRQEYGSELPFPPLGNLPDPGIKPMSSVAPALTSGVFYH